MTNFELIAILPKTPPPTFEGQIRSIGAHGYTAVLSPNPARAIKLPPSRKQALQDAAQRQTWLEACLPFGPVLACMPKMHVGTADIPSMIIANAPLLDAQASKLWNKVQFQITVSWDPAGVLSRFRDAPEIMSLFSARQVTPHFLAQQMAALSARLRAHMTDQIEGVSVDMIALPRSENMLMNIVVLQDANRLRELDDVIDTIDALWTEGLQIRQIGPAPAASFVSLSLQRVTREDVVAARDALQLAEVISEEQIRDARRRALLESPAAAELIRANAAVLAASLRIKSHMGAFHLCSVQTDGQPAALRERWVA